MKIKIGIDPGVHTGVAFCEEGKLVDVTSMQACEAEVCVTKIAHLHEGKIIVYYEDARLRNWFGSKGREALQGAGSIKRDCQRWEQWLKHHNIPHVAVAPKNNKTKLDAAQFKRLTGWEGRTNEHSRDAAMLIVGR
jgi:ABC-type multidrug transport system ATPase subunit